MKECNGTKAFSPITREFYDRTCAHLLTASEEKGLARQIAYGDLAARNELVCRNLSLVLWVAKRVARKYVESRQFLEVSDMVQEGMFGLIKAAEKFDPNRGCKFSTYAVYWIRQSIDRALDNQSLAIRVPVHTIERRKKIQAAIRKIAGDSKTIPPAEVIAKYLEWPLRRVENTLKTMNSGTPVSLNTPINGDDGTSTLQDFIADKNAMDPAILIEARQELEVAYIVLRNIFISIENLPGINQRRNAVLFRELLKCTEGGKRRSLAQVGKNLGLSRERIRQILNVILEKLSHQGIKVDIKALGKCCCRIQALEELIGESREEVSI